MGNYSSAELKGDCISALNVAMLAVPQGMAYALIAGLPVYYGIIGSGVASILGGIFGGKKFITLGPTNATAVLLFGMFANLGMIQRSGQISESAIILVPCILFASGLILLFASLLRVSFFVKFISRTVITAYITAASLLIIANQIKNTLGITALPENPITNFTSSINFVVLNITYLSWQELMLSAITAILFLIFKKYLPSFPNVACSLVISSFFAALLNKYGFNIKLLEPFTANSSVFSLPNFGVLINQFPILFETACAISILCIIEGLAIGKSLASRSGQRIESNRETLSFGCANLACSMTTAMPCSGSLTRSSLNIDSGAKTKASNIFSGVIVILLFLLLANYIKFISLAALSTLVIFIGISLIKPKNLKTVTRATRSDTITFIITFVTALLFSLQTAIFTGVFVSILLFLKKVAEPEMVEQGFDEKGILTNYSKKTSRPEPEVSIVHVEGELFFAAADLFYEQMRRAGEDPNIKVLILKLLNAHHLDATSVMALEELIDGFKKKNCHVLICEVRRDILRIFRNAGILQRMNRLNIFPHSVSNPTLSTAKAVRRAKELVKGKPKVNILSLQQ